MTRLSARTWSGDDPAFRYPETSTARPATGVCFSGGGTRSYAATVGQLRGLIAAGLWPHIGYVSAVSGGAWAATVHAFHPGAGAGAATDTGPDIILGAVREPSDLDAETLAELSTREIGSAATRDFRATLAALHRDVELPRDEIWIRAVGETFLAPFGLYEAEDPRGFTLDAASETELRARNPQLEPLHRVRDGAESPYLLVHTTLNWPEDDTDGASKVGFELSPLYSGARRGYRLTADGRVATVGGGYVESVGFGAGASPFTLAQVIGLSSAFSTAGRDPRLYPHVGGWPVASVDDPAARHLFSDGGDLENFGIISLLCRGVRTIVVFVNTVWPLSLDLDPDAGWPVDPASHARRLDPFLAPLFGAPSSRFPHNQVFAEAECGALIDALQAAKRAGETVAATRTHRVVDNEWWGLEGGWDVEVRWIYNERVPVWEARLPAVTRRTIQEGTGELTTGPVAHFPHYKTRGQNPGALIRLTPTQVNLLSHLSCWTVTRDADALRALMVR